MGNTRSIGARDEDRQGPDRGPLLLLIAEGTRPTAGGARYCLGGLDQVTVGRGSRRRVERSGSSASLRIPDEWMSSKHAVMSRERGRWLLEDPGSKNGVKVNGVSVSQTALSAGDVVEVGKTVLVFCHGEPGDAPADTPAGMRTTEPGLARSFGELRRIAAASSSVLIRGETGTGKELVARAVHDQSGRGGAFVPVNCGALVDSVMQSELFGYSKGAFSGADADRDGLLVASSGGTLFLDEIGDLSAAAQAALLRALQEQEVRPVGATSTIPVDLRVVAASHRDLPAMAEAGGFREDLLARLSGYQFQLPPLRERVSDLGDMIAELLRRAGAGSGLTVEPEVLRALVRYHWPRNVRELANTLERAVALASDGVVVTGHLPQPVRDALTPAAPIKRELSADELERRDRLVALLSQHAGNISAVARELGKVRAQIQRWIKRYDIDIEKFRR